MENPANLVLASCNNEGESLMFTKRFLIAPMLAGSIAATGAITSAAYAQGQPIVGISTVVTYSIDATQFVGLDFDDPALDMKRIAEGFGARTERIEDLQSVGDILGRALAHSGPSFLIIGREP